MELRLEWDVRSLIIPDKETSREIQTIYMECDRPESSPWEIRILGHIPHEMILYNKTYMHGTI